MVSRWPFFFLFKQKTAYEMRISDWSSDVCSSDLEGLSQLLKTVERVRSGFNRSLSILGVALTMYDRRNNLSGQVADDVRAVLGKVVFETVILRNVRLSEAPSHEIGRAHV